MEGLNNDGIREMSVRSSMEETIKTLQNDMNSEFLRVSSAMSKLYEMNKDHHSLLMNRGYLDCISDILSLIENNDVNDIKDIKHWCKRRKRNALDKAGFKSEPLLPTHKQQDGSRPKVEVIPIPNMNKLPRPQLNTIPMPKGDAAPKLQVNTVPAPVISATERKTIEYSNNDSNNKIRNMINAVQASPFTTRKPITNLGFKFEHAVPLPSNTSKKVEQSSRSSLNDRTQTSTRFRIKMNGHLYPPAPSQKKVTSNANTTTTTTSNNNNNNNALPLPSGFINPSTKFRFQFNAVGVNGEPLVSPSFPDPTSKTPQGKANINIPEPLSNGQSKPKRSPFGSRHKNTKGSEKERMKTVLDTRRIARMRLSRKH